MTSTIAPIIILPIAIWVFAAIRFAQENERFAVFVWGQFKGFKGPGLILKLAGPEAKWLRLRLGNAGDLVTANFVRFKEHDVPLEEARADLAGKRVQIVGFGPKGVLVQEAMDQRRSIVCGKCGHENFI